jgi:proline iminopeptidase
VDLYEPFDSGWLDVGDGHRLFYEQLGAEAGIPIVYLHGGPGSGCALSARRLFDPRRHRAVLFDQRAAGRSTPAASTANVHWSSIDMDHHIADIERLRDHLGLDRWAVTGASWGSVLALTYAERHPHRVSALVVAAVSTGTADDVAWITEGCRRHFPAQWEELRSHLPSDLGGRRLVDVYGDLVMDPDPSVHGPAAVAWCRWEDAHSGASGPDPRFEDPTFRLAFARQVTHCWRHASWLADDEIVDHTDRLAGIPGRLIHGRLDLSSPLLGPWRIHQAWPGSELVVLDDVAHGGSSMSAAWQQALVDLVV